MDRRGSLEAGTLRWSLWVGPPAGRAGLASMGWWFWPAGGTAGAKGRRGERPCCLFSWPACWPVGWSGCVPFPKTPDGQTAKALIQKADAPLYSQPSPCSMTPTTALSPPQVLPPSHHQNCAISSSVSSLCVQIS